MAKILVAGFMHETNTFCPQLTLLEDFEQADAYPAMTEGEACFEVFQKNNIVLSGFIEQAQHLGHEIIPLLWCNAPPFGLVTKAAYEKITQQIIDGVNKHNNVDAIFLDLHGAMVSETTQDGEGELINRLRKLIGDELPIACGLDLHANISQDMFEGFDLIEIYRTYPHVDMFDTGVRAANLLDKRLTLAKPLAKCFYKLPFLIPMNSQCTLLEPAKGIYDYLTELNTKHHCSLAAALGFPLADIFDCGPAVVAYGEDQAQVNKACKTLYNYMLSHKNEFKLNVLNADEAVDKAISESAKAEKPTIIADTQDNPGGGGTSDTTGLLRALVKANAKGALLAIMHDPAAAEHAHAIGLNNEIVTDLGGRSGLKGDTPFHGKFTVKALSNGHFKGTGPYYHNVDFDLGPMAALDCDGVQVIVSSRKMQAADKAIFTHMGIDPSTYKILALKSSVHFRADFSDLAEDIIIAIAPGYCTADIQQLDYKNLRSDVEIL